MMVRRTSRIDGAVPEIDCVRRATNKLVSVVWSVMKGDERLADGISEPVE